MIETRRTFKALTVWQPWASLILAEVKPYEFRGWPAPKSIQGTEIAIHAGARPVRRAEIADLIVRLKSAEAWTTGLRTAALPLLERWYSDPSILPLSSILGTATLGTPRRAHEIVGELGGYVNDSDRHAHSNWAWPLTNVSPMVPVVPAKGMQGFWQWQPYEAPRADSLRWSSNGASDGD